MCQNSLFVVPPLFKPQDIDGNEIAYYEEVYRRYKNDFYGSSLMLFGKRVLTVRDPLVSEKEWAFVHATSNDSTGRGRTKHDSHSVRRTKRIGLIRPIIENIDKHNIFYYKELTKDKSDREVIRMIIWCPDANYKIVLQENEDDFRFITAFLVLDKYKRSETESKCRIYNLNGGQPI